MAKGSKRESFADRLLVLKGDMSYQALAENLNKGGFNISAQALHKWIHGGGISAENLGQLAAYFGVPASELFFGEAPPTKLDSLTPEGQLVGWAWALIPERFKKELRRDIFTLATGYAKTPTSEREAAFHRRLAAAMRELKQDF